jgi:hypothetical protein
MAVSEFATAVAMLRTAVDALLDADASRPSGSELAALSAAIEVERSRLTAVDQVVIAELDERQLAGDFGRTSTADLLGELSRLSPAEAKARVRAAHDMGPRREFSGAPLAPLFARVADAQRDGLISAAHARVITGCIDTLPSHLAYELAGPVEQFLVEHALHLDPKRLAVAARRLLATVDPDGAAPRDEDQHRRRDYALSQRGDGSWTVGRSVTDDFAAVWGPIIDSMSAPQASEDGIGDDRTPGQRRHDAMVELGARLLRSGWLPDAGGTPVTVLVRVDNEQFETGEGVAVTESGATIGMPAVLRLVDGCELITTAHASNGAVLCLGRTQRLASRAQRRALAARDLGCCFPGCTRPASWCEAHHVIPWLAGGLTDLDNLCLLCRFHHREFERRGWLVRIVDGVPEWIPPPWLDPLQQPRRNTAHHVARFDWEAEPVSSARAP